MFQILDELKAWLEQPEEPWARKAHWPSDLTSCRRKLWYKWHEVEESDPTSTAGRIRMLFGDAGEFIVSALMKHLIKERRIGWYHEQVRIKLEVEGAEYPIVGKIDAVFGLAQALPESVLASVVAAVPELASHDLRQVGEHFAEIKTAYGRGIRDVQQNGAKRDHLWQVFPYHLARPAIGHLVYIGRDDAYRTEILTKVHEEELVTRPAAEWGLPVRTGITLTGLQEKVRDIEAAVALESEPERDYQAAIKNGEIKAVFQHQNVKYKSDWQCRYCNWRSRCWAPKLQEYAQGHNAHEIKAGGDEDE